MIIKRYRWLLIFPCVLLSGCPNGEDQTSQGRSSEDHVWQEQTRTIEKANEVQQIIQNTSEQHRRVIEEQSQ